MANPSFRGWKGLHVYIPLKPVEKTFQPIGIYFPRNHQKLSPFLHVTKHGFYSSAENHFCNPPFCPRKPATQTCPKIPSKGFHKKILRFSSLKSQQSTSLKYSDFHKHLQERRHLQDKTNRDLTPFGDSSVFGSVLSLALTKREEKRETE